MPNKALKKKLPEMPDSSNSVGPLFKPYLLLIKTILTNSFSLRLLGKVLTSFFLPPYGEGGRCGHLYTSHPSENLEFYFSGTSRHWTVSFRYWKICFTHYMDLWKAFNSYSDSSLKRKVLDSTSFLFVGLQLGSPVRSFLLI